MAEKFEELAQLLSGYFHQDWDIEGATDADVILAFRRTVSAAQLERTLAEVDRMLQLFVRDSSKIEKCLTGLGCEYFYHADGLTGQEWLQRVRFLLTIPDPLAPSASG